MRFTSFIVAGLFAVAASAQTTTTAEASTSVSTSDPAQSSASEIEQCLAKCDDSDTRCRANCIAVPSPDTENVNATTACVAACPQGNGTAADNQAYADCVQNCIAEYYYTSTGTPNLATSAASNVGSSVTQVATTIVSDGSTIVTSVPSTASGSSSPASTTSPDSGAAVYGPVGAGIGLFALLAGFIAL
ncbi:hypothetical protein GGS24DRAFT_19646 [Hypoxylon argillaceum]|nr:hypothetical protein GGS24DRAFT_19646 [Hypoxylon argillaceum]